MLQLLLRNKIIRRHAVKSMKIKLDVTKKTPKTKYPGSQLVTVYNPWTQGHDFQQFPV